MAVDADACFNLKAMSFYYYFVWSVLGEDPSKASQRGQQQSFIKQLSNIYLKHILAAHHSQIQLPILAADVKHSSYPSTLQQGL